MGYFEEHPEKYLISPGTKLCQVFGQAENANASVALVKMEKGSKDVLHYHDNITEIYFFSKENGIININGNEHKVSSGDCYVITSNNTHFVEASSDIDFVCVCIPPWTEEHEFVTKEFISDMDFKQVDKYGTVFKNEKIVVEYNTLSEEKIVDRKCEEYFKEVYYFAKGTGKIIIDGLEKEIHEGEGFEISRNEQVIIKPNEELTYLYVGDKFN